VETNDRTDDAPRNGSTSGEESVEASVDLRYFPPWMREELIQHFQGIDGVTTDEAKQQIEAYERNFMAVFGGVAARPGPPGSAGETAGDPAAES
jgi:hypothetical protein